MPAAATTANENDPILIYAQMDAALSGDGAGYQHENATTLADKKLCRFGGEGVALQQCRIFNFYLHRRLAIRGIGGAVLVAEATATDPRLHGTAARREEQLQANVVTVTRAANTAHQSSPIHTRVWTLRSGDT